MVIFSLSATGRGRGSDMDGLRDGLCHPSTIQLDGGGGSLNKLAIRATPPTIPLNGLATDGALDDDPLGKPVAIAQPARLDAHQVAAVQVLRPVEAALVFDGRAAVVEQARIAGVTAAFQADHLLA